MATDPNAIACSPDPSTGLVKPICVQTTQPQVSRVNGPPVWRAGQIQLPTLSANSGG